MLRWIVLLVALVSCQRPLVAASASSSLVVANRTGQSTTVYVSFGANSVVRGWSFCVGSPTCSFRLAAGETRLLPSNGRALNVTIAFGSAPSCGTTVSEVNFSIPGWNQDTANISLVNGWSNDVQIDVSGSRTLGPTQGPNNNATVFGVYPNGCDICVARQRPPCGITPCPTPGSCGCKSGSQYNPAVPCQSSFRRGSRVTVALISR